MTVNVSEAKAQLSSLLDRVYHGETVTIAKNNLPIADLVKHQPRGTRRLGLLRGRIVVPDDFSDEDPAINELFLTPAVDARRNDGHHERSMPWPVLTIRSFRSD